MNIALIPARSGSKGVPSKNIKILGGHPLIAYSIAAAKMCRNIDHVIVSTDSDKIADIARYYGATVPFIRPAEFATDTATAYSVVRHFCEWCCSENFIPDLIVFLTPTTPLRDYGVIESAITYMQKNYLVDSLRSVHELAEPPQKMMQIRDGCLIGFFPEIKEDEYWNLPRQTFPKAYHPNGYVEVIKPSIILNTPLMYGGSITPLITDYVTEIDRLPDFEYLEYIMAQKISGNHYLRAALDTYCKDQDQRGQK